MTATRGTAPPARLRLPLLLLLLAATTLLRPSQPAGASGAPSGRTPLPAPVGFGAGATGGAGGPDVWVTSLEDDGPGTFRAAASTPGRAWIRFAVPGTIRLRSDVAVAGGKTIDGRDNRITIDGAGLRLTEDDVIIESVAFDLASVDRRTTQDALLIDGADRVWVDHCSFTGGPDKLIGVPAGRGLTLSWNAFRDHEQAVQLGTYDTREVAGDLRATLHHNLFEDTGYRNPRVSYGEVHAFNNYVRRWREHGMSSVRGAQLLSEANVFEAGEDKNAIIISRGKRTKDHFPGAVRSVDDLLLNGATVPNRQSDDVFDPAASYRYSAAAATPALAQAILAGVGPQLLPASAAPAPPASPSTTAPAVPPPAPGTSSTVAGPATAAPAPAPSPDADDGPARPLLAALAVVAIVLVGAAAALRRRPTEEDR